MSKSLLSSNTSGRTKTIRTNQKNKNNKNLKTHRNTKQYIDFNCNINQIDFEIRKKLSSNQDSASEATVYLVKGNKDHKNYVIKNVEIDSKYNSYQKSCLFNEIEMYKIMNLLSSKNVTPHIITSYTNYLCNPNLIPKKNKTKKKNKYNIQNKYYIFQINEAQRDDQDCITLRDFMNKYVAERNIDGHITYTDEILLNILFQILYTLYIFTKIKLNHNDLHLGNILIYIDRNLPIETQTTKYIYGDNPDDFIYLKNLGYSVRIFDFDRSFKNKLIGNETTDIDLFDKKTTDIDLFDKEIKTPKFSDDENENKMIASNIFDDNRDVYKMISHIIDVLVTINPTEILPILLSIKRNDYYNKYIYGKSPNELSYLSIMQIINYYFFRNTEEYNELTFILFNDLKFFTEGWYLSMNYDALIQYQRDIKNQELGIINSDLDPYLNSYFLYKTSSDPFNKKYVSYPYLGIHYHFISNPIDDDAQFKSTHEIVKLFANILKTKYQGNDKGNVLNTYDYHNLYNKTEA